MEEVIFKKSNIAFCFFIWFVIDPPNPTPPPPKKKKTHKNPVEGAQSAQSSVQYGIENTCCKQEEY